MATARTVYEAAFHIPTLLGYSAGSQFMTYSLAATKERTQNVRKSMETSRLRVGAAITPEQFEELSDAQLERLIPKAYREFFPGKENCADGYFYLHDGTAWSFYKAGFLDE